MPIFMVERQFAEQLDPAINVSDHINQINDEENVRWLMSFLSADKSRSYCLYEAHSIGAIRRAAERAGLPADAITELGNRILPDGSWVPVA